MRKLMVSFLGLLFIVSLTACGSKSDSEEFDEIDFEKEYLEEDIAPIEKAISSYAKVAKKCYRGICFEVEKDFGGQKFKLAGMAERDYLWTGVYTIALYLPIERYEEVKGVPKGPKVIMMEYHLAVLREEILESYMRNFRANQDINLKELKPSIKKFFSTISTTQDGDKFIYFYDPGRGTHVIKNKRPISVIPGEKFAHALFGVWLSEEARNQEMRMLLMGPE